MFLSNVVRSSVYGNALFVLSAQSKNCFAEFLHEEFCYTGGFVITYWASVITLF